MNVRFSIMGTIGKAALFMLLILSACAVNPPRNVHDEVLRARKIEALLTRATLLMRRKDAISLDESFGALELARELAPKDSRVLDGLGCVEWRRGNYALAEHFFNKARKENPFNDRVHAHLALAALRRGNRKKAQKLFERAIELEPLNHRSRNNYAVFLVLDSPKKWDIERSYQELLRAAQSREDPQALLEFNLKQVRQLRER